MHASMTFTFLPHSTGHYLRMGRMGYLGALLLWSLRTGMESRLTADSDE